MNYEDLLQKLVANRDYVLTQDEASYIWQEHNRLIEDSRPLVVLTLLRDQLTRELAKGKRCGVCGRYENPSCVTEC